MRLIRFVQSLRQARRLWLRSPVCRRNVRALWIQSDPAWREKLPPLQVSDEEFEAWMKAIK